MTEPTASPAAATSARTSTDGPISARPSLQAWDVLLLTVSVIVVAGTYISLYPAGKSFLGFSGIDAYWYAWRISLVAGEGLRALPDALSGVRDAQAFRAGFPSLAGFVHTLTGAEPRYLIHALPAVAATIASLASSSFARAVREPRWGALVYAVVVGVSANMVLSAKGHSDTLLALSLMMAAASLTLLVAGGGRAAVAGALLLVGAATVHWSLAAFFGGIVLAFAVALVPESVGQWRRGGAPRSTPAARVGLMLGGAAAAGAATMALLPAPPSPPAGLGAPAGPRLASRADPYRFAAIAPAAALGAVALLTPPDRGRRRGLLLSALWAGTAALAAALVALRPDLPVHIAPAHRILALALGIPLLAAAGIVGVARWVARPLPVVLGRIATVAVIALALSGVIAIAVSAWQPLPSSPLRRRQLSEASTVGRYLQRVGGERTVVFISNAGRKSGRLLGRRSEDVLRSALPSEWIAKAVVYFGDSEALLAGRPTTGVGDHPEFEQLSTEVWQRIEPVVTDDAIVLSLSSMARPPEDRGAEIAPGVVVLGGPSPPDSITPAPAPDRPSRRELGLWVAATLLLVTGVGLGWSVSFVPVAWVQRIALAPALGTAVLCLGGVLAGRVGLAAPGARLGLAVTLTALGWTPATLRKIRPGRAAVGP